MTRMPAPRRTREASTAARSSLDSVRRAARPALALLLAAGFIFYAIAGSNGLLAWADHRRLRSERKIELALLESERSRTAHHVRLLDPRRADPDFADEMIRRGLGLIRPDEVIIPIED